MNATPGRVLAAATEVTLAELPLVRVLSGLIRRLWLRAAKHRAERAD